VSGTKLGVLRAGAINAGLTVAEYEARLRAGKLRCSWCEKWKVRACFSPAPSRPRGRDAHCRMCRREIKRLKAA
jgi:hypothetical protein